MVLVAILCVIAYGMRVTILSNVDYLVAKYQFNFSGDEEKPSAPTMWPVSDFDDIVANKEVNVAIVVNIENCSDAIIAMENLQRTYSSLAYRLYMHSENTSLNAAIYAYEQLGGANGMADYRSVCGKAMAIESGMSSVESFMDLVDDNKKNAYKNIVNHYSVVKPFYYVRAFNRVVKLENRSDSMFIYKTVRMMIEAS